MSPPLPPPPLPRAQAVKARNVFFYLTYEGGCDLSRVSDEHELDALSAQLNNFGQTPSQLFAAPHPPRRARVARAPAAPVSAAGTPLLRTSEPSAGILAIGATSDGGAVAFDSARRLYVLPARAAALGGNGGGGGGERGGAALGGSAGGLLAAEMPVPPFAPRHCTPRAVAIVGSEPRSLALVVGGLCDRLSRAFSAQSGDRLWLESRARAASCVGASACGGWLVTGGEDGLLTVWTTGELGAPDQCAEPVAQLHGHEAAVCALAVCDQLGLLASGDAAGLVLVHALRGGAPVLALDLPRGGVVALALAPREALLVVGGAACVRVLALDGTALAELEVGGAALCALALARRACAVVCGFGDGGVRAYTLQSLALLAEWAPAQAAVSVVCVADDALLIGTATGDVLSYSLPPTHAEWAPP